MKPQLQKIFICTLLLLNFSLSAQDFITTWNTEAGDPGNATITLPIIAGAYDVDFNNLQMRPTLQRPKESRR